jgi:hypothetical protein
VADLHVLKPLLSQFVSDDLLESTQRLALQGPPQTQVSTVRPEAFGAFLPSGSRQVEVFRAHDLNARNDVMSLNGDAANATQVTILRTTERDRSSEEHAS